MTIDGALTIVGVLLLAMLIAAPGVVGLILVSRRRDSASYETMERTLTSQSERILKLERQAEGYHNEIERLRNEVAYLRQEVAYWKGGVIALRAGEEWTPRAEPVLPTQAATLRPIAELVARIERAFNDDELADLALQLGINMEDMEGDTHKSRARGLVDAAERRDLLAELVAAAKVIRPRSKWD